MARGFGSTLGAGTTDVVALAAFTMPSKCSVWVRYLKNGLGGANFGRLFEKTGPSNKEITLSISTTTKMFIERDFSTTNGVWEFDDPQANTVGLWADVLFTYDDSSTSNVPLVWVNGRSVTVTTATTPVGTAVNTSSACYVGNWSAGTRNWDGIISKFAMWNINLGYREAKQLLDGFDPLCIAPYAMIDFVDLSIPFVTSQKSHSGLALTGTKIRGDKLLAANDNRFPFGSVSSAITGTASITEADDTASATGTVLIAGVAAISEADDAASGAAGLSIAGVLAATEGDDTLVSASTLALAAALAANEEDDSVAGTGALAIAGTLSASQADDTIVATGVGSSLNTGALSATEADDTAAATAALAISGVAAISEADDAASGAAGLSIAGAASITEGDDTTAATGALALKGTLSANDNDDTLVGIITLSSETVSRLTGLRPTSGASRLRTNLSTGARPAAVSRG